MRCANICHLYSTMVGEGNKNLRRSSEERHCLLSIYFPVLYFWRLNKLSKKKDGKTEQRREKDISGKPRNY